MRTISQGTLIFLTVLQSVRAAFHERDTRAIIHTRSPGSQILDVEAGVTVPFQNVTIPTVCLQKGCVQIAASLMNNMDDSVDPCDNFYHFACGSYVKYTSIPAEKASVSILTESGEILEMRIRYVLEKEPLKKEARAATMTRNLYRSCMNEALANYLGLQPLRDAVRELGGWPVIDGHSWNQTNFSMMETLYKIHELGFPINFLFSLEVQPDHKNASQRTLRLDQPELGLEREYLIKDMEDPDVQAYLEYSTSVAVLFGAAPAAAREEMKEMLLFEIQLAKISSAREDRRNFTNLYNVMSLEELERVAPGIPWLSFINILFSHFLQIDKKEPVVFPHPHFFRHFSNLVNQTPKRTLANYMIWRVIKKSATYLSEDIRVLEFDLKRKLMGLSQQQPRWKECSQLVQEKLYAGIGNLYIKNFFDERAKKEIEEIVSYLRESFDNTLHNVDWMDEATRNKALEKAKAFQLHLAYPDELLMDSELDKFYENLFIDEGSLLDNLRRFHIFKSSYDLSLLREKVDRPDWKMQTSVAQANAYYDIQENSIKIPAGVIQGVLYEPHYPKFMKYAGIGMVIGHEITHGFDDRGRQFGGDGSLKNWWHPETEAKYMEKAKCIVDQYSKFQLPEGMQLNAINSQGEDIADNGGTKAAYMGYQQWVKDHGPEQTLPGLPYDANQLFWISLAQKYCEKSRPEFLRQQIMTGFHSPDYFRLIGPIQNSYDFSKDFSCKVGSPMNPIKKCAVW